MPNTYPYTLDLGNGESITYSEPQILNMSNPLGLGYEVHAPNVWTDGTETTEHTTVFQVAIIDGSPFYGAKHAGRWSTPTRVRAPERFGPLPTDGSYSVKNLRTARAWVAAFTRGEEVGR